MNESEVWKQGTEEDGGVYSYLVNNKKRKWKEGIVQGNKNKRRVERRKWSFELKKKKKK